MTSRSAQRGSRPGEAKPEPPAGARAPWNLVTIDAPAEQEEEISRILCARGALGVEAVPAGGRVTLRAWFEAGRALPEAADLTEVCAGSGEVRVVSVTGFWDGRWVERWIESLQPIPIGDRFVVIPVPDADAGAPPDAAEAGGRLPLLIVPGRAFGTGEHATTRLCLEALERHGPGERLLDVGTGSGILAIAAASLGCPRAVGIDVDGDALRVARRNVLLNDAGRRVSLVHAGPEAIGGRFDRVLANLTAGAIASLMPVLVGRLGPGGLLVLSGLLDQEADEAEAGAAREGAAPIHRDRGDGWACTVLRRSRA